MATRTLKVLIDGVALPDDEARSVWERFSVWMEDHRGDLGGFATREGWKSVHPGVDDGQPTLFASRSHPQGPYVSVHRSSDDAQPAKRDGGSDSRHESPATNRSHGRSRWRNSRK